MSHSGDGVRPRARGTGARCAPVAVALATLLCWPGPAMPQAAPAHGPALGPPGAEETSRASAEAEAAEALLQRAGRIRDLVRGRLAPAVDAGALFEVDLAGGKEGEASAAVVRLLGQVGARRRAPVDLKGLDALGAARATLEAALVDFLRRPAAERARLLRRHERRRLAAQTAAAAEAERQAHLEAVELQATRLEQILDGRLAPDVDPAGPLRIDLADPVELAADPARRARFLEGAGTRALAATAPGHGGTPAERLTAAIRRLDAARLRWLALPPAERAALLDRHRQGAGDEAARAADAAQAAEARRREEEAARAEEARRAAAERATAQQALDRAVTEAARLAAEEKVRLLASSDDLSRAEADLRALREGAEASRERALGWRRRVRDLAARSVLDGDREGDADRAYQSLVTDLTAVRSALAAALDDLASNRTRIPPLPAPPDPTLHDTGLERRRAELDATAQRLRALEEVVRWERVATERDAMASMNQARLQLLGMTTPATRTALRGFGPTGVRQGLREVTQISLELRYHRHWLPRQAAARLQAARAAPLPELVGIAELVALAIAFRWWRRRADRLLRELQAHYRGRRVPSPIDRAGWTLAWYLRRIRAPLEWLALVLVLAQFPTVSDLAELDYLALVVAWSLGGWLVMKLLDAVAARQGEAAEGTAALRWRSLRLGGVTVVGLGLLLSVADRSVGQGTLYSWISTASWVVVAPVLLLLVAWWRPVVFARIRARERPSALLGAVLSHAEGPASFPAAAVGGLWLLAHGVGTFLLRQASQLTAARRVLAWLFRRELERHAAARVQVEAGEPLREAERQALHPERPRGDLVESAGRATLDRLGELVGRRGTVVAVVGERGLGKTTLLDRLLATPAMAGAVRVATRPGGFDALVADLAAACELESQATAAQVAERLRELAPPAVCLDDLQRIVRPVIGGLADVDRLLALAREIGPATSWVAAVGTPGYGYLERAREGRVTFDEVLRLEPWSVEEIGALVRARTREAGLSPSFDELVVARPDELVAGEGRRERTERDFHGLLWDYAGGNPAAALALWGESLLRRPGGDQVVVRLADAPTPDDLEDLPLSFFFVLRAVLQLELASEADVALCTDLRPADVADALRLARARGLVEPAGQRLRLSLRWFRAVSQALRRRHLVAF